MVLIRRKADISNVSNWENGNVLPSIEMLVKIADYFLTKPPKKNKMTNMIYIGT